MAVMQQRILHLLEQYQLGQEGASGSVRGGMAAKVRQVPVVTSGRLAEGTNPVVCMSLQAAQACKVI